MPYELSVIIPTYKEASNIDPLIQKLRVALGGIDWEVVFVDDDSPDGTADRVWEKARTDPRVRCIKRIGRRGLSSACIEGMLSSSAPFLAVMDADMQHDETILPQMLAALKSENLDMVIGSRYIDGGGMKKWSKERIVASQGATRFAQGMTGIRVEDPMSGFFMLRRELFHQCVRRLNGRGFKILFDLLTSSPQPLKLKEIPYTFALRQHGESKLSFMVIGDYFVLVFDKTLRRHPWVLWFLIVCLLLIVLCVVGLKTHYCPLR